MIALQLRRRRRPAGDEAHAVAGGDHRAGAAAAGLYLVAHTGVFAVSARSADEARRLEGWRAYAPRHTGRATLHRQCPSPSPPSPPASRRPRGRRSGWRARRLLRHLHERDHPRGGAGAASRSRSPSSAASSASLVLVPWLMRKVGSARCAPRKIWFYTLRAGVSLVSMLSWFYGITLVPLATATALNFTAPLFATARRGADPAARPCGCGAGRRVAVGFHRRPRDPAAGRRRARSQRAPDRVLGRDRRHERGHGQVPGAHANRRPRS